MLNSSINMINDNFGSKRGFLNYARFKTLTKLGRFAKYSEVDWSRVERLVFVCHGNICRSSLAEGVAKAVGANTISLGIACRNGAEADPRAIAYANTIDIDLSQHRTQSLQKVKIVPGDLIVVMEPDHLRHFDCYVVNGAQLTLAGLWDSKVCAYIHDPYSCNDAFFAKCESRVAAASCVLVAKYNG